MRIIDSALLFFLVLTIAGLLKVKLKLWNSEDENIKCKNSPLDNIFLFELIKIVLEGSLGFVEVILVKVGVVLKVVLEWLNSDERLEQSVRCNSTFQLQQRSVLTQICNKSYWDRTISPILYNWTIQWNLTQCRQPRLCGGLINKSYNEGTVFPGPEETLVWKKQQTLKEVFCTLVSRCRQSHNFHNQN